MPPYRSQFAIPFEDGPPFIPPPPDLLPGEAAYWHNEYVQLGASAVPSYQRKQGYSFAEIMYINLSQDMQEGERYARGEHPKRDPALPELINRWYAGATTWAAFSRLWREGMTEQVAATSLVEVGPPDYYQLYPKVHRDQARWRLPKSYAHLDPDGQPDVLVDFLGVPSPIEIYGSDLRKFGLLLRPHLFRSIFEVEPPVEQVKWLEGETIFVEAQAPAEPTYHLIGSYETISCGHLWEQDFVTARAHLKRESWPLPWEQESL